jgi:hypothetical protein
VLPPAGQLPAAAILTDNLGFRQLWFPPAVDVEISFIPRDEIAALVEESLALPPIDLLDDPEDLDATGVVVLAPVDRPRLQRFEASLTALSRATLPDPAQGIRRAPADMLAAMLARRAKLAEALQRDAEAAAAQQAADAETKAWQVAWNEAVAAIPVSEGNVPLLWYIRRRAVADSANVVGTAVAVAGDDARLVQAVNTRLADLGLNDDVDKVSGLATPFASARMIALLGSPRILQSDMLLASVVHDLDQLITETGVIPVPTPAPSPAPLPTPKPPITIDTPPIFEPQVALRAGLTRLNISRDALATRLVADRVKQAQVTESDIVHIASDYGNARLGDGLDRLAATLGRSAIDREGQLWVGGQDLALPLDAAARDIAAGDFAEFAKGVAAAITAKNVKELGRLVGTAS